MASPHRPSGFRCFRCVALAFTLLVIPSFGEEGAIKSPPCGESFRKVRAAVRARASQYFVVGIKQEPTPLGLELPEGVLYGKGYRSFPGDIVHKNGREEERAVLFLTDADPNTGVLSFVGNRIEWIVGETKLGVPSGRAYDKLIHAFIDKMRPDVVVTASLEFSNSVIMDQVLKPLTDARKVEKLAIQRSYHKLIEKHSRAGDFKKANEVQAERDLELGKLNDEIAGEFRKRIIKLYPCLRSRDFEIDGTTVGQSGHIELRIYPKEKNGTEKEGRLLKGGAFINYWEHSQAPVPKDDLLRDWR